MDQNQLKESSNQEVEFEHILKKRYLSYAISTIVSRSLPDVRDGLKPVHRRIIYAMYQLKLSPEMGFKKCARIVGDVIGKYHPHGDTAVYDALVRLAQSFATRYPIVEGQGNFGSIDGDSQAAMRYTEAKLTKYATLLLSDLELDTVDWQNNYDNSDREPVILPTAVPNILANGSEGIAVGMATSIPPHNIVEICQALIHLIKNPKATNIELTSYLLGPDFPTGGIIVSSPEEIRSIYETGKGNVRLRAKWHTEILKKNNYQVVINEIPYQVTKKQILEQLALLYENKKLPLISDFKDLSDEEIRLIIIPNQGVEADLLMESLFKATDLEVRIYINMNALNSEGNPQVMPLKQILTEFLEHRYVVVKRKLNYLLNNIISRLEVLQGLLIAYLNLDEVIHIIREEENPKQELLSRYNLTEKQVEAILNMRLRSLAKLEQIELEKEIIKFSKEKQELETILNNENKTSEYIVKDLKQIQAQYSKDKSAVRKTTFGSLPIVSLEQAMVDLNNLNKSPVSIIISKMGWIRTQANHNLTNIKYKDGDEGKFIIESYDNSKLVLFSNFGKFYTVTINKLSRKNFEPIRVLLDLANQEDLIAAFDYSEDKSSINILIASEDGKGFIVPIKDVIAQTKSGKQILNCEAGKASICKVVEGEWVASVGQNHKLLLFPTSQIPIMRRGKGVSIQKFNNSKLADIIFSDTDQVIRWERKNQANNNTIGDKKMKELKEAYLWRGNRGGFGRIVLSKIWID